MNWTILALIAVGLIGSYLAIRRAPSQAALEYAIYVAISELGDGAHGTPIRERVESRLGRKVSIGHLYAAFDKMERDGFIRSWQEDGNEARNDMSKRCFGIKETE